MSRRSKAAFLGKGDEEDLESPLKSVLVKEEGSHREGGTQHTAARWVSARQYHLILFTGKEKCVAFIYF